jgi:hypothetical protein
MLRKMKNKLRNSTHFKEREKKKKKRGLQRNSEQEIQRELEQGSRSNDEPANPRRLPSEAEPTSVTGPRATPGAAQNVSSEGNVNSRSDRASLSIQSEACEVIDLTIESQSDEDSAASDPPERSPGGQSDVLHTETKPSHLLSASGPARATTSFSITNTLPADLKPTLNTAEFQVDNTPRNDVSSPSNLENALQTLLDSYESGHPGLQDVKNLTSILDRAFHVNKTKNLQSHFGQNCNRARYSNLCFKNALRAVVEFREKTGYTGKPKDYAGQLRSLSSEEQRAEARDEREILRKEIKVIIEMLEDGDDDYRDVAMDITRVVVNLTKNKGIWGPTAQRMQLLCDDMFGWAEDGDGE